MSFPIENMVIYHSYVSLPEGMKSENWKSYEIYHLYNIFFHQLWVEYGYINGIRWYTLWL